MNNHHVPTTIHHIDDVTDSGPIQLGQPGTIERRYQLGSHTRTRTIQVIQTAVQPHWSVVPADWGIETTITVNNKQATVRCQPA